MSLCFWGLVRCRLALTKRDTVRQAVRARVADQSQANIQREAVFVRTKNGLFSDDSI